MPTVAIEQSMLERLQSHAKPLRHMLRLAANEVGSLDGIRRLWAVNLVVGQKRDEGYRHLAEAGISYQGLNANVAVVALAKRIGVAIDLGFEWRPEPQASHPGLHARLCLSNCRAGA